MSKKIFCFDIDNTICKTSKNHYLKSTPFKSKIKLINQLYDNGHKIIFFTSRGMSKYRENKKVIYQKHYHFTKKQLKKWGVKHHKLILCKPSYDIFIDDKNLNFKKTWDAQLRKYLK